MDKKDLNHLPRIDFHPGDWLPYKARELVEIVTEVERGIHEPTVREDGFLSFEDKGNVKYDVRTPIYVAGIDKKEENLLMSDECSVEGFTSVLPKKISQIKDYRVLEKLD